jgi:hypothetical protein
MPETLGTDPGAGISGFGVTLQGSVTGAIGMVTKLGIDGFEVDALDISTMNNPQRWKTFIAGMKDAKQISIDLLYEDRNTVHILGSVGNPNENWTVTFSDGSTFVCSGFIMKFTPANAPDNDKITGSLAIKLSGIPVFASASGS